MGLISTFAEVTKEKLVARGGGEAFWHPPPILNRGKGPHRDSVIKKYFEKTIQICVESLKIYQKESVK